MTKEEAIYLLRNTAWLAPSDTLESVEEAVHMATEALERMDTHDKRTDTHECVKPTHECDVISRDKALNLVLDVCYDVMDECETVTGICGEEVYTDVREVDTILKCNKGIRNGIRQLPSAEPKTGEWIDEGDPLTIRCSKCDYRAARYNNSNYCPNCGARMKGADDGEN